MPELLAPEELSANNKLTSFARTELELIVHEDPLPLSILLLTSNSSYSLNCVRLFTSVLSSTIDTSEASLAGRFEEPPNMTSSMSSPRICFALDSPITHFIASTTLDFPQPFGPTMPVRPS